MQINPYFKCDLDLHFKETETLFILTAFLRVFILVVVVFLPCNLHDAGNIFRFYEKVESDDLLILISF